MRARSAARALGGTSPAPHRRRPRAPSPSAAAANKPLHVYAGREIARALALGSTAAQDCSGDLEGLTREQLQRLDEEEAKIAAQYDRVGEVRAAERGGRGGGAAWCSSTGQPGGAAAAAAPAVQQAWQQLRSRAAAAAQARAPARARRHRLPAARCPPAADRAAAGV